MTNTSLSLHQDIPAFNNRQLDMPELPEVETVRHTLAPVMTGARFDRVILHRQNLRRPFPRQFVHRLKGQRVLTLSRRGKYLVAELSSGEALLMHLGMSGSFRVDRHDGRAASRREPLRHDHVVFQMSSGATITFNDPRRFGLMDLASRGRLDPALDAMGPEPLEPGFDGTRLAGACAGKRVSLKGALLDQRVVAGLGNIYASEALHRAGLSPRRRASTIATSSGHPRPGAHRLATAIKEVLQDAVDTAAMTSYRGSRFRVYDREGEACRTRRCGGTVRRISQAGRSTFYCPKCQR